MRRALVAVLLALGLALPSGAWANRVTAKRAAKPGASQQTRSVRRKPSARAEILHRLRSRGVIKPSERLFANSGIAGGPSLIFSAQNVERRVTRKGARPGETERVNVKGRAVPSATNKSGWTVRMTVEPAQAPAATLQK
jgi:hypothetical protein